MDFSGIVHVDYPGTPSNHGFYWLFQLDDSKSLDEKNGCFTISIHGKNGCLAGSTIYGPCYMGKSTLKIDRYCPLVR